MKTVVGDLIQLAKRRDFDFILHGCNCFHTWGAGIALQIKKEYPQAYQADLNTDYEDEDKLGTISFALAEEGFIIINCYTQFRFSGLTQAVNYEAIQSCMRYVTKFITTFFPNQKRIGFPLIGAGLGGGDWDIISKIIKRELSDFDYTLVKYNPRITYTLYPRCNFCGEIVPEHIKNLNLPEVAGIELPDNLLADIKYCKNCNHTSIKLCNQ